MEIEGVRREEKRWETVREDEERTGRRAIEREERRGEMR